MRAPEETMAPLTCASVLEVYASDGERAAASEKVRQLKHDTTPAPLDGAESTTIRLCIKRSAACERSRAGCQTVQGRVGPAVR